MAASDRFPLRLSTSARHSAIGDALLRMAPHDWLLLGYLVMMLFLTVFLGRRGSGLPIALAGGDLLWFVLVLYAARDREHATALRSFVYRITLVALPLVSYLQLRWILPVIAPYALDTELLAFDLRVFGYEPALAWDAWVSREATEWFAFFYYSYFFLLALHAIPIALFVRDGHRLREFAFGLLFVFCAGHLVYVLVPAVGPHAHAPAAAQFTNRLEGPFFWPLVESTVKAGGASGDVFPSLHTAVPAFLALYSFQHRRRRPYRFTWPLVAVFASQIILATMYLRWHWLADILAGLLLATLALLASERAAEWEARRRARRAIGAAFPRALELPAHTTAPR